MIRACINKMYLLFFIILTNGVIAQTQQIDSAKNALTNFQTGKDEFLKTLFFIADTFMDEERYDSAQVWLNKIHESLPAKKSTLFHYFILARQAEVYYYNNLLQLGLRESNRGLEVAKEMNDSLLLADSYNFLGLFHSNLDNASLAIPLFKQGLLYTRQPPYTTQYISLSKPHHLLGNLSEAYFKLNYKDSALLYAQLSVKKATEINDKRGIAIAHSAMGEIFVASAKYDSALHHYNEGLLVARQANEVDVELLCYSGMATCFNGMNNLSAARQILETGFNVLQTNPTINPFFITQFLNVAIQFYRQHHAEAQLVNALAMKAKLLEENLNNNNRQVQAILQAGLQNENRLQALELNEAFHKQDLANTRIIILIMILALLVAAFFWYRSVQNQKIRMAQVRQNISQDLHDDIGASLSSLQIYGTIAEKTFSENPGKAMEMIRKISMQSRQLLDNMNDIVWSMKAGGKNSSEYTLEQKIKNFGAELFADQDISFSYHVSAESEMALQSIHARKNVLLLVKEAINNIAKYSKASEAVFKMEIDQYNLITHISDNGRGFDMQSVVYGNGLKNIQRRAEELKGKAIFNSAEGKGTYIDIIIPLQMVSNLGWQ